MRKMSHPCYTHQIQQAGLLQLEVYHCYLADVDKLVMDSNQDIALRCNWGQIASKPAYSSALFSKLQTISIICMHVASVNPRWLAFVCSNAHMSTIKTASISIEAGVGGTNSTKTASSPDSAKHDQVMSMLRDIMQLHHLQCTMLKGGNSSVHWKVFEDYH